MLSCRYRADRFRCALGLLCSHAPTKRVPGLNACPWLPVGGGNENQARSITQMRTGYTSVLQASRSARTRRSRLLFMEFRMLLLNIFTSLRALLGGGGQKRAQQSNVTILRGHLGCGQGNDSRKTYVLHSKARWQRKLLHHPAPDASQINAPPPPSTQATNSRGTGCPVEQHRWRDAGPPRDLKRRLSLTRAGGSQCVKSRHSIKYDSSSNLLSHFHHRPTSSLIILRWGARRSVITTSSATSKGEGVTFRNIRRCE